MRPCRACSWPPVEASVMNSPGFSAPGVGVRWPAADGQGQRQGQAGEAGPDRLRAGPGAEGRQAVPGGAADHRHRQQQPAQRRRQTRLLLRGRLLVARSQEPQRARTSSATARPTRRTSTTTARRCAGCRCRCRRWPRPGWSARTKRFADHAVRHLRAWFVDTETRDEPAACCTRRRSRNKVTGRSIGVIDTIHLVEVARAAGVLEETGALAGAGSGRRAQVVPRLPDLDDHPRIRHHRARRQEQPRHLLGDAGGGVRALRGRRDGHHGLPGALQEGPAARPDGPRRQLSRASCGGPSPTATRCSTSTS